MISRWKNKIWGVSRVKRTKEIVFFFSLNKNRTPALNNERVLPQILELLPQLKQ